MVSPDRNTAVERRRRPRMFTTYSHLQAEGKYRREVLRDQNRTTERRVGKTVTTLVLVGALALAACGVPVEANTGAAADPASAILTDNGPTWEPNRAMLEAILTGRGSADEVLGTEVEEDELGVMPAPSWQPSQKALGEFLPQPNAGSVNDTEPFGHPNYGRLATYLGAETTSGPR
jgi:hypothetical protein